MANDLEKKDVNYLVKNPNLREFIAQIGRERKTGKLLLTFNQGGLRMPAIWTEKSPSNETG